VAGLGSIGFRLARDLARSGETVVAIERQEDGEFVQAARELAPVVLGNAKTEETLRKAGVAGAKALVAATDDDLANLSIALATKRSRASCRVVLRIFDSALAEKMQRGLPIDAVLSVSAAAAPTLVGSVLCPDLLQGILLENHLVLIFCRRMDIVAAETRPEPTPGAPSEFALFVKPAGAAAFEPVTAESTLRAGDQVIGARCYPLKKRQADP
jgi:Trk K+ transport system NAD-binding subunit